MKKTKTAALLDDGLIGDENGFDSSSEDYSELQDAILVNYSKQTEEDHLRNELTAIKCKMIEYLEDDHTELVSVGEYLKDCLKKTKIKQKIFAAYIGWNPGNFTKLLNGSRKINYELAVILGNTFNIEPALWLRVQDKNEFIQLSKVNTNKFSGYSLKKLYEFAAVL